jgi:hypothetical protein
MRLMHGLTVGVVVACAAALPPSTVLADWLAQNHTSGVSIDGTDVTVNAGITGIKAEGVTTHAAATDVAVPQCTTSYRPLDPASAALLGKGVSEPGAWWVSAGPAFCHDAGGILSANGVPMWIPAGQSPAADPLVLAREAVAKLPLLAPAVRMSPSADRLLVQLETWLWIDRAAWRPLSATASVGPVASTALAEPAEVRYDMGDGHQVICRSPGAVYDASVADDRQQTDCGYAYHYASYWQPGDTYTITATVYWRVRWSSVGVPGGGDLGLVPGPAATVRVHVGEIHAVNVEPSS